MDHVKPQLMRLFFNAMAPLALLDAFKGHSLPLASTATECLGIQTLCALENSVCIAQLVNAGANKPFKSCAMELWENCATEDGLQPNGTCEAPTHEVVLQWNGTTCIAGHFQRTLIALGVNSNRVPWNSDSPHSRKQCVHCTAGECRCQQTTQKLCKRTLGKLCNEGWIAARWNM